LHLDFGLILLVMIVAVPRGIVALAGTYRRRLDDWIDADDVDDEDPAMPPRGG
jgi:hypothetical protein